jgi:hypothetical protein
MLYNGLLILFWSLCYDFPQFLVSKIGLFALNLLHWLSWSQLLLFFSKKNSSALPGSQNFDTCCQGNSGPNRIKSHHYKSGSHLLVLLLWFTLQSLINSTHNGKSSIQENKHIRFPLCWILKPFIFHIGRRIANEQECHVNVIFIYLSLVRCQTRY